MRQLPFGILLLTLAACQAVPTGAVRTAPTAAKQATASPSPSPKLPAASSSVPAGVLPSGVPTASPTPAWPAGPSKLLSGSLRIDAGYALKMGGQLLSNNGGGVLSIGSGLLSHNGGGLISDKGMGLIANNGSGLIANNGGGLGAQGLYRLAATELAPGAMLPAKGLMVTPISLTTGRALGPTVLTDETGHYAVQVPETQTGNVFLFASVPGKDAADPVASDPRLRFSLVVPATQATTMTSIDEDSALVTRYMRSSFLDKLNKVFKTQDDAEVDRNLEDLWIYFSPSIKALLLPQFHDLAAAARQANYLSMSDAQRLALRQRVLDVLLAHIDFAALLLENVPSNKNKGPALQAMNDFMRHVREKASAQLTADPDAMAQNAAVREVNATLPPEKAYKILKGADFGEFILQVYMYGDDLAEGGRLTAALDTIGAANDPVRGVPFSKLAYESVMCVTQEMMKVLLLDSGGTKTDVYAVLKDAAQRTASPTP